MERLMDMKPGDRAVIVNIPDPRVRAETIRFGICEGTTVKCSGVIPGGPVLIANGRAQYALGRKMAQRVLVRMIPKRRS